MSPALPASTRYFAPNVTDIWFVPTIADPAALTRAELSAGTLLSDEVADTAGWNISSESLPTPGLKRFTGSIPGHLKVDDSSITFYADRLGVDIRTVLTLDLEGYIVYADGGDVTGGVCDVFPVRVGAVGKPRTVTGSTAQHVTVKFDITDEPTSDVDLPAAA